MYDAIIYDFWAMVCESIGAYQKNILPPYAWSFWPYGGFMFTMLDVILDVTSISVSDQYFFIQSWYLSPPHLQYDIFYDPSSSMYEYLPVVIYLIALCLNIIIC